MQLSVGDLIADSRQPRHAAAVQFERASAPSHQHGLTVVVTKLFAEQVGEIGDDAGVADQLPKGLGETV